MPWGAVAGAAVGLIGSSMQADATESAAEKSGKIDPRMDKYIYGDDSMSGLLADSNAWYNANKSGLNDQMRQGLNQQWATYNDPSVMAGYRQQQNLGSGLMGAPVMGNPFSDGRVSLMSGGGMGSPNLGLGSSFGASSPRQQYPSYQPVYGGNQSPITASTGPFAAPPPAPPAPPVAAAPAPVGLPPGQLSNEYQGGWRLLADPSTGQPFWGDKSGNNVGFYDGGNTGNGGA